MSARFCRTTVVRGELAGSIKNLGLYALGRFSSTKVGSGDSLPTKALLYFFSIVSHGVQERADFPILQLVFWCADTCA